MSAAAHIGMRRRKFIRRFREAGALDSKHAVSFESLGMRRSWVFDQMVEAGAFLETRDGRYYMDEEAALEFLRKRKKRALIIFAWFVVVYGLLCLVSQIVGK